MNNKRKTFIAEFLGWYGVIAILLAYILISFQIIEVNTAVYQLLNITGAIGIIIDAINQKNYQPAVLNIIWAIIAVVALIRIFV